MNIQAQTNALDGLAMPKVHAFYDPNTSSIQYVVEDPSTGACAVIDPVLDFDEKSGRVTTGSADKILAFISDRGLDLRWILDTHPHADHLSAAYYMQKNTGAATAIGEKVVEVQRIWQEIYGLPPETVGAHYWDHLFADGDYFTIGSLDVRVLLSPGHTLASITYVVGDAAFIHDTLFMPDSGCARADFPGGSAGALWDSIQRIIALGQDPVVHWA
jgi:glyoxylase-like metal-dependent hydrolase (beta-lactamase superfamily II)